MSFKGQSWEKMVWVKFGGTGDGSSLASALPLANGDLFAFEAGVVVESVNATVVTAVGTATAVVVGDDDAANGFIADADLTEATPGSYKGAGSYITAGKYYAAAGKEAKISMTGTASAGVLVIMFKGYKI